MRLLASLIFTFLASASLGLPASSMELEPDLFHRVRTNGIFITKAGTPLGAAESKKNPHDPFGLRTKNYYSEGLTTRTSNYYNDARIFIDRNGKQTIKGEFRDAKPFQEGLAAVRLARSDKFGYIDKSGKMVIAPQFYEAENFSDGLANVRLEDGYAFINKTGKIVFRHNYAFTPRFSLMPLLFHDGLLCVRKNEKFGFLDKTGKFAIAPKFKKARSFTEGLAPAALDEKWGFIDKSGNFVIPPSFDGIADGFDEGKAVVYCNRNSIPILMPFQRKKDEPNDDAVIDGTRYQLPNAWCKMIDRTGKVICEYDTIGYLVEGLRKFETAGRWGFIDNNGVVKIVPKYSWADNFRDGRAWVETNPILSPAKRKNDILMSELPDTSCVKNLETAKKDIEILNIVLKNDPENAAAYRDRAYLYMTLGQIENAVSDFDRTLRLYPLAMIYEIQSDLHLKLSKDALAAADLTKAIELRGTQSWDLKAQRAKIYYKLKQYEKALADLNACISFQKDSSNLRLRASVYKALNKPALAKKDELQAKNFELPILAKVDSPGSKKSEGQPEQRKTVGSEQKNAGNSEQQFKLFLARVEKQKDAKRKAAEDAYRKSKESKTKTKRDYAAFNMANISRDEAARYEQSDPAKAEKLFLRAIEYYKEDQNEADNEDEKENLDGWIASVKTRMANMFYVQRNYAKAEPLYQELIKSYSDRQDATKRALLLANLGEICRKQNRFKESEEYFRKAQLASSLVEGYIDFDRDRRDMVILRGYTVLLRAMKRDAEAIRLEEELITVGRKKYERDLRLGNAVGDDIFLADSAMSAGHINLARKYVQKVLKSNFSADQKKKIQLWEQTRLPNHAVSDALNADYLVAVDMEVSGELELAERLYRRCLKGDSNFEWPYRNLATIKKKNGKLDEAKDLLKQALKANPNYLRGWVELSQVEKARGDLPAAREAAGRALTLNPDSQMAQENQAQLKSN